MISIIKYLKSFVEFFCYLKFIVTLRHTVHSRLQHPVSTPFLRRMILILLLLSSSLIILTQKKNWFNSQLQNKLLQFLYWSFRHLQKLAVIIFPPLLHRHVRVKFMLTFLLLLLLFPSLLHQNYRMSEILKIVPHTNYVWAKRP